MASPKGSIRPSAAITDNGFTAILGYLSGYVNASSFAGKIA
jgi:hypothetical protein